MVSKISIAHSTQKAPATTGALLFSLYFVKKLLYIIVKHTPFLFFNRVENNTIWLLNLHLFSVHNNNIIFHIHPKKCHGIGFMIERHQKFIVRKHLCILWIITAYRQYKILP